MTVHCTRCLWFYYLGFKVVAAYFVAGYNYIVAGYNYIVAADNIIMSTFTAHIVAGDDDDEVMLNVLRCRLTYLGTS